MERSFLSMWRWRGPPSPSNERKIEKQKREQAENERLAEEARKEAHRLAVKSSLPPEPDENESEIVRVKVRRPDNDNPLERRFSPSTKLQGLLNYLIVQGYPPEEYKVLLSWPRTDVIILITQNPLIDNFIITSEFSFSVNCSRCKSDIESIATSHTRNVNIIGKVKYQYCKLILYKFLTKFRFEVVVI